MNIKPFFLNDLDLLNNNLFNLENLLLNSRHVRDTSAIKLYANDKFALCVGSDKY